MGRTKHAAGRGLVISAAVGASLIVATPARAGSFDAPFDIEGSYKLTTTYALAVRMGDPSQALINGPIDPFEPGVLPNEFQVAGFTHTGLPTTINLDDGNRNFDRYSPINNRLSAFWELQLRRGDFGLIASGAGFYDWVVQEENDRDAPIPGDEKEKFGPNNNTAEFNEFVDSAVYFSGERSRTLEAYIYGNFYLGDEMALNVRLGKHLFAFGESLFFPGIVSAQAPNDATKAFVPGAEIKEILLPVNQISMQFALGGGISLLGYYQFDYRPTEVFPVGTYFSVADVVGPGAEFAYGSVNPAFVDGCPGLFDTPAIDLSFICNVGGIGGPLLNAPPTINVPRLPDIRPDDDGRWGVGLKAQVTPSTTLGAYYLRYGSFNPTVQLNLGFAFVGSVAGQDITTEVFNQVVPISYNVKYFDDIEMIAASYSTTLLGLNVAGEFIYRDGVDVSVAADLSGVRSPIFKPARTWQSNVSALYVANPKFWFYDEVAVVGEAAYLYVDKVLDPIQRENGVEPVGDGTELFYDQHAWAYQMLILPKGRNIVPGWDIGTPIAFAHAAQGYASTAGTFGSLFGEGDRRIGLSVTAQYLQNLEFAVGYNWFLGNPRALVKDSPIPSNPVADRDYATFTIKYNL